jgi:glucose/arabinose dehydrogenase
MRAHSPASHAATLLLLATVFAACSGDDDDAADVADTTGGVAAPAGSVSEPVATSGGRPITTPPMGSATSPAVTTAPAAPAVVGDPVVGSELVATVESPINAGVRPDDDGLYVLEQAGRVVRIGAGTDPQVVADLTDRVEAGGERGLLGIAFSGDGTGVWLHYSGSDDTAVVAEYIVAGDGTIDVDSERVLLTLDDPYPNHNGGDLVYGPDGMLWIAIGDGGSGGDPERRASDPESLFGKILRIDPNPSGDSPYGIPPDNPFGNEVWALGLRNPWKIDIDPVSGELWIADVGQNVYEEIDVVAPTADAPAGRGANFGWSAYEGNEPYNGDVDDPGDLVFPVHVYDHSLGCSISGGEVYRGTAIAELAPAYVYSDHCSGTLWAFDAAGGRNLELGEFENVAAVRSGPDGELYVLEAGGNVYRLVQG